MISKMTKLVFRSIVCRLLSLHYDKNTLASHAVHALRKRHASFAQKDYNGILKTNSFAVYSISDSFSYTLSSVTFFQKANRTTDAVLLLNYILFTISASGLFLKLGYSRKNPHPPDGWGPFLTPPLTWIS